MIILTRAQAAEYVALLADLREGRLVRASQPVQPVPAVERALALVPEAEPEGPLPPEVVDACRSYGRGKKALDANFAHARRLLKSGLSADDVVLAIAQGRA